MCKIVKSGLSNPSFFSKQGLEKINSQVLNETNLELLLQMNSHDFLSL